MIDEKTDERLYPLPHRENKLREDVERIRSMMMMSDADMAVVLEAIAGKANIAHNQAISTITGLQSILDGKAASDHTHILNDLSNVDDSAHANGQVLSWQTAAWVPVTLQIGNIAGLEAALNATSSSESVDAKILALKNELLNGVGSAFDTLKEFADALGNDANFATTNAAALAARVTTTTYNAGMATKLDKAGDTATGTLAVRASGSVGGVRMVSGDATRPGYVEFLNPAGASVGQMGWNSGGSRINMTVANGMIGHQFGGDIVAAGNVSAFSDARLKTNKSQIFNALETLLRAKGWFYDKDGKRETGVIAQELYTAIPELVNKPENPDDLWSVKYGNALGYIIEAFRDMDRVIADLRAELDDVKTRMP